MVVFSRELRPVCGMLAKGYVFETVPHTRLALVIAVSTSRGVEPYHVRKYVAFDGIAQTPPTVRVRAVFLVCPEEVARAVRLVQTQLRRDKILGVVGGAGERPWVQSTGPLSDDEARTSCI